MAISSVLLVNSSRANLLRGASNLLPGDALSGPRSRAPVSPVEPIQADAAPLEIVDVLELSPQALAELSANTTSQSATSQSVIASQAASAPSRETAADEGETEAVDGFGIEQLTDEEEQQVQELEARDREVRAHEQAHIAAAGPYALGPPSYEFQQGPDGRNYAIGGEVQIDTAPVEGDPEATIRKAQVVRAAALAPAEPSAQDRRVAAAATQQQAAAQAELQNQQEPNSTAPQQQAFNNPSQNQPNLTQSDNFLANTLLQPLTEQIPLTLLDLQA